MDFFFTALAAFPLVMTSLTLLVGDRVNHCVNLIGGAAYGLFGAFAFIGHLVAGDFDGHIQLVGLAGILAFLIAGLSLLGLREATPQAATPATEEPRPRERATV